jgi:hypothetical protein
LGLFGRFRLLRIADPLRALMQRVGQLVDPAGNRGLHRCLARVGQVAAYTAHELAGLRGQFV